MRLIGLLYAVAAPLCWGAAIVLCKPWLDDLPPLQFLSLELTAGCTALWLTALLRPHAPGMVGLALRKGWLGVLEPGLAYLVGLFGLRLIGAGEGSLIGASESLMILVVGRLFFKQTIGWTSSVLAVIAMAGLSLVLGLPEGGLSLSHLLGDSLFALAALIAAFYVLLSARMTQTLPVAFMLAGQQTVALGFTVLALLTTAFFDTNAIAPISRLWLIPLVVGLIQNALAFFCFFNATHRLGTALPSVFLTLAPVTGLLGGVLFLGESLSLTQAIGSAVTLVALALLSRQE